MKSNKGGSVYFDYDKENPCGYIDNKIWINGELRLIRRNIYMFSPLEHQTFSANELREIADKMDELNGKRDRHFIEWKKEFGEELKL
jgi:hypothetical protein